MRLIFPKGIIGFPQLNDWVLEDLGQQYSPVFNQLRSLQDPCMRLFVTDPELWFPTYRFPVGDEAAKVLGFHMSHDYTVFLKRLVIINRQPSAEWTLNLTGPIVFSTESRYGMQLTLSSKAFNTQVPVMPVLAHLKDLKS